MKRHFFITVAILSVCLPSMAKDDAGRFTELDRHLEQRSLYTRQKESRIDSLKRLFYPSMDDEQRFQLYNDIYQEYYTYRFDSAMSYVEKEERIAMRLSNPRYLALSIVHRSVLLSTSGYFSESIRNLQQMDARSLKGDSMLLCEYYAACEWAYSMWAEYSDDKIYAPEYYKKEMLYQDSLVSVLPQESSFYHYWKAENLYRHQRYSEAEGFYKKALENTPVNMRLYAMATFGLALVYKQMGDWEQYEYFLIQAAISDQVCPLKENLALQELALYIFQNEEDEVERANRYLNYSMEDALFYNNRLRMLEIAQKFPSIIRSYQEQSAFKNVRLQWSLVCISLLALGLIASSLYIYRQMRLLHKRRLALSEMNGQLQVLNKKLTDTNVMREQYVGLFMDLCAAYIEKLGKYQDLVKRKVKAKQTDDLLKLVNATRLSDADAKEFFVNFDTAFVSLYPDFIEKFNALLREGEEIKPKRGEIFNTELRIFALIRMGIKDSSKIATLLFYSPQTIYNYRSAVKNKAKDKEHFERQVEELCNVM